MFYFSNSITPKLTHINSRRTIGRSIPVYPPPSPPTLPWACACLQSLVMAGTRLCPSLALSVDDGMHRLSPKTPAALFCN